MTRNSVRTFVMKKQIFLGKTPKPEVEKPRRAGIRFVARAPEPEVRESQREGIRFVSRSKSSATPSGPTPSNITSKSPPGRPQKPGQRNSSGESGGGPKKVVIALVLMLFLIFLVAIFHAAAKPRVLPPVAAPRTQTDGSQERMWMKEYMQKVGPSEELKSRRARMNQFQYTGGAANGQQN
jgi:hypothetical protein